MPTANCPPPASRRQETKALPPRKVIGNIAGAFAGKHTPKSLGFNPAKLTGLSERLITSHWENNYQESVRGLNTIETRLAAAMADPGFPPVAYAGLKREE